MQMVPNDKKIISRIFIIFTEIKNSIKHFGIIKELLQIYVRHKRSIFLSMVNISRLMETQSVPLKIQGKTWVPENAIREATVRKKKAKQEEKKSSSSGNA